MGLGGQWLSEQRLIDFWFFADGWLACGVWNGRFFWGGVVPGRVCGFCICCSLFPRNNHSRSSQTQPPKKTEKRLILKNTPDPQRHPKKLNQTPDAPPRSLPCQHLVRHPAHGSHRFFLHGGFRGHSVIVGLIQRSLSGLSCWLPPTW